jgi:hypothetical protein
MPVSAPDTGWLVESNASTWPERLRDGLRLTPEPRLTCTMPPLERMNTCRIPVPPPARPPFDSKARRDAVPLSDGLTLVPVGSWVACTVLVPTSRKICRPGSAQPRRVQSESHATTVPPRETLGSSFWPASVSGTTPSLRPNR